MNAATTGLQSSATSLGNFGDQLAAKGDPLLGSAQKSLTSAGSAYDQVGSYLSPILQGNRGAVNQALAPDLAAITETYRGAGKAIEGSGLRGGTRDLALAELNRDRAGKLALLPTQARAGAASGMMDLGSGRAQIGATQAATGASLFGQATNAKQGAAGAYGTLFGGAQQDAAAMREQKNAAGGSIGRMIFDATQSTGKKGGGGNALNNKLSAVAPTPAGWTLPRGNLMGAG